MLKQISCRLFQENGQPRGPVNFHMGLNTVLGAVKGEAGSIGKSTMMLIIDFAFGGNTYASSDAVKELDEHAIDFVFEFDGQSYHFSRTPSDPDVVLNTDGNGHVIEILKIDQFTQWLSQQYRMNKPGVQFRNTLSRFFRIYGKNNHNELKPLQTRGGDESQKDAIAILIAVFEYYETIKDFKNQLQEAEDRIMAFRGARKYEFIPSAVDGMTKYKQNVVEIAALEKEQHSLAQSDDVGVDPGEVEKANERNEIKRRLNDLRRSIKAVGDELHLLKLNIHHGAYPTDADLRSLQQFFPEANLAKIVEIEKFHTKIQAILAEELETAHAQVVARLEELQRQEAQLLSQLDAIPPSKAFTDDFLDAYTDLDRRIKKLQDQNEAFDTRDRLQNEKREANERYQKQLESVLQWIEIQINSQMEAINEEVTGGEYNAPRLTLNAFNRYKFETPRDTGTGTNHRGMVIYDLAVAQSTVLPAIAHDSIMFDSMSSPDKSNLIRVYNDQIEKQIFISIDKISECTEEAKTIIDRTMVLKLDNNEHALFGEKWSKKEG